MIRTASQMLHDVAHQPTMDGCSEQQPFRCWVCAGTASRGQHVERWMGSNFVGQNRVRCPDSPFVCEACMSVMAGKPPDMLRMYTHLVDERGWLKLNKGDKPRMREWLRAPKRGHWLAAIADSGQKHVIPWTPVCSGDRGRVMFEETPVMLPSDARGWALIDEIAALLTAGATKEEVERGDYGMRAWTMARSEIDAFERARGRERTSPWFSLALWLAQRDEAVVQARLEAEKAKAQREKEEARAQRSRKGKAPNANRRDAARGAKRVSAHARVQHPQALGSTERPSADGGAHEQQPGRVGHVAQPVAQARGPQLGLFGGDDGAHERGP